MTAHAKATRQSQALCDLLLDLVQNSIQKATRNEANKVCSMGETTRFAYIYHRREGVRMYLRSRDDDGIILQKMVVRGDVTLTERKAMESPWAKQTSYYLDIDTEAGVRDAVPLVLYAASQLKSAKGKDIYRFPSEESEREMVEGARTIVEVSKVERDPTVRRKCIALFGARCAVCGFDFENTYGEIGNGFIHVHHLKPLAIANGPRRVDPKSDLRPVCPNCHEMLHQKRPPYTIEEMQGLILQHRS